MKLYRRHIASGAFDNAADYPEGQPFEAGEGFEWVEGDPPENAEIYRLKHLNEVVSNMYGSLPIDMQTKYTPEIVASAEYFRNGNYTMLYVITQQAKLRLELPDEQAVSDIIELVLTKLQELM